MPSLKDRLIVALDVPSEPEALRMADRLADACTWVKVGLELFIAAGPGVVGRLRERGFQVFLDLKLHDIPNTVAAAVRSAATCGVSMLTVHAAGGGPMLEAAAEEAQRTRNAPMLLGVTVLTSLSPAVLASIGILATPEEQVVRLAGLARRSGLNGLVCSPREVAALREMAVGMTIVTPGVRPAGSMAGDQVRIATPAEALQQGADLLVVGRPIIAAPDPAVAAQRILDEMATVAG